MRKLFYTILSLLLLAGVAFAQIGVPALPTSFTLGSTLVKLGTTITALTGITTISATGGNVITSATQFDGFAINNGSNTVAQLLGTSASNDNGQVTLRNGGTVNVVVQASGASYMKGGSFSVGTSTLTGNTGELGIAKITASGSAPGAGNCKISAVAGTTANTCKLIAYCGTSATATTILDNIGTGC